MTSLRRVCALALVLALGSGAVRAQDARRSGFAFMSPQTQAMQRDDMENPGMLAVLDGADLWARPAGLSGRSCADCHGPDGASMRGVAARYPAFDAARGGAIDLAGRIMQCSEERQGAAPPARESRALLALTAFVGHRSRGMDIAPDGEARMKPVVEAGRALWHRRLGQLSLSCAQCHDDNAGQKLASATIPQAHPTGYPIYRLEWQTVGSLQRRIRGCLTGVRAEPFAYGDPEYIALEAFLMERARGMAIETPAVRP